jgi:hypothetical protein
MGDWVGPTAGLDILEKRRIFALPALKTPQSSIKVA